MFTYEDSSVMLVKLFDPKASMDMKNKSKHAPYYDTWIRFQKQILTYCEHVVYGDSKMKP